MRESNEICDLEFFFSKISSDGPFNVSPSGTLKNRIKHLVSFSQRYLWRVSALPDSADTKIIHTKTGSNFYTCGTIPVRLSFYATRCTKICILQALTRIVDPGPPF